MILLEIYHIQEQKMKLDCFQNYYVLIEIYLYLRKSMEMMDLRARQNQNLQQILQVFFLHFPIIWICIQEHQQHQLSIQFKNFGQNIIIPYDNNFVENQYTYRKENDKKNLDVRMNLVDKFFLYSKYIYNQQKK